MTKVARGTGLGLGDAYPAGKVAGVTLFDPISLVNPAAGGDNVWQYSIADQVLNHSVSHNDKITSIFDALGLSDTLTHSAGGVHTVIDDGSGPNGQPFLSFQAAHDTKVYKHDDGSGRLDDGRWSAFIVMRVPDTSDDGVGWAWSAGNGDINHYDAFFAPTADVPGRIKWIEKSISSRSVDAGAADTSWHVMAVRFDVDTNPKCRIYIDDPVTAAGSDNTINSPASRVLYLGGRWDGTGPGDPVTGALSFAELVIYGAYDAGTALTDAQFQTLFNGLKTHYKL